MNLFQYLFGSEDRNTEEEVEYGICQEGDSGPHKCRTAKNTGICYIHRLS